MSFGVFLLNQIHALIGKESSEGRKQGRQLNMNTLEDSQLDLLFEPPPVHENDKTFENAKKESFSAEESTSPGYVNNMFRALLNLVNAYTKDSQVLECIWSLYCQDLDKTSAKEGLYGIAARINRWGKVTTWV